MTPPDDPHKFNVFAWLRNSFLAGVAVVLPFVVTVWLIWLVVTLIDNNVTPLIPAKLKPIAEAFPGGGVLVAVVALTLVGAIVGNFIGRWIIDGLDKGIANLPLVRS